MSTNNEINFKNYLLFENKVLFSQRVGDIMNGLQELIDNPVNIGKDKGAKQIVDQIRSKILKTKWSSKLEGNLRILQNCAANILMSLDPKKENRPDLNQVLSSCLKTLQQMSGNLEAPINNLMGEKE